MEIDAKIEFGRGDVVEVRAQAFAEAMAICRQVARDERALGHWLSADTVDACILAIEAKRLADARATPALEWQRGEYWYVECDDERGKRWHLDHQGWVSDERNQACRFGQREYLEGFLPALRANYAAVRVVHVDTKVRRRGKK